MAMDGTGGVVNIYIYIYENLGLYNDYKVIYIYIGMKARPNNHINLTMKLTGKPYE